MEHFWRVVMKVLRKGPAHPMVSVLPWIWRGAAVRPLLGTLHSWPVVMISPMRGPAKTIGSAVDWNYVAPAVRRVLVSGLQSDTLNFKPFMKLLILCSHSLP